MCKSSEVQQHMGIYMRTAITPCVCVVHLSFSNPEKISGVRKRWEGRGLSCITALAQGSGNSSQTYLPPQFSFQSMSRYLTIIPPAENIEAD